ncbi:MAG: PEP/pyruvate-binding domain-containing protein [Candidatus Moraniibacteriota bacterium]
MTYIKTFKQLNEGDSLIAGGKGASLGEMLNSGIPVPDGFVVITNGFLKFIKDNKLDSLINTNLAKVKINDSKTISLASNTIRKNILSKTVPAEIEKEILEQFKKLNTEFVAVRSSATAEDGANAAWAGQLESYLNSDSKNLINNIKKCWASLYAPRAIFYRIEQGFKNKNVSVAVVVQKMVNSESSGIAFSVHPVTQDNNQIIIEAGFGLGEAIVGGEITPDSYVFDKSLRKIVNITVNTQKKGLYKSKNIGNTWVKISEPKASSQTLSENQILKLSDNILCIEKHYGFPCDIEWAIENGKIFIVQSRPITTLMNKATNRDKLDWVNLFEVPFRFSIYSELGLKIFTKKSKYKKFPGCKNNFTMFYQYNMGITSYFLRDEINQAGKLGTDSHHNHVFMKNYLADGTKLVEKILKFNTKIISKKAYSQEEISKTFYVLCNLFEESFARYKLCNDEFQVDVYNEIKSWFKKNNILNIDLIQELATPHNLTSLDLVELEILQTSKNLLNSKKDQLKTTASSLAERYSAIGGGAEGGKIWDKKYFENEITVKSKTFTLTELDDQILKIKQRESKWQAEKNRILKDLKLPSKHCKILEQMAMLAHLKFEIRICWAYLDKITEKLYRIIGAKYNIPLSQLAFYETGDIKRLIKNNELVLNLKERKLSTLYIVKEGKYSTYYGKNSIETFNKEVVENDIVNSEIIKGQIASGGIVTGKARIVSPLKNQEKELSKVKSGDVLVTGMTRPHMLQAMKKAVAFVTDEGGITCHAAIISREMKKPCIVATRQATKIIKDGDIVEVDAINGIVKIIKRKNS